jgi:S-DNA-T family DNA segregation ATPase FtsK/SpoIIIE
MEWSGVVGDFCAGVLARLLGRTGGSIALLTLMVVYGVLATESDPRALMERARVWWLKFRDWHDRRREQRRDRIEERRAPGGTGSGPAAATPVRIARPPLEEPPPRPARPAPARQEEEPRREGQAAPADEVPATRAAKAPEPPRELRVDIGRTAKEEEIDFDDRPPQPAPPEEIDYVFPSVELLDPPRAGKEDIDDEELKANADLLRSTLAEFDVEVESVSVTPGPVITLYELVPASGVKISRIVSLENDIALKLAARGIRIMAPIPGKSAVGVEIPNNNRALVTVRSVINSSRFRDSHSALPLAMGKTIAGEVFTDDLSRMPHLLIAGSTGSGKSVGINTILLSLLYRLHPSDLKLVIIDPKKIELAQYGALRHHFLAASPDADEEIVTTPQNAVRVLRSVELEMEKRYDRLAAAGVRNILDYNERFKAGRLKNTDAVAHQKMPYLIVVIDELADLMITAAREVEEPIARLAQLARAVGVHLIVATQRPSVDVITGVIKANFPARIAYQVASKTDSRTILDMNGAEQLLGNGDMLYLASGSPKPIRLQNAFVSTDEVERLMTHIGRQKGYSAPFTLPSIVERKKGAGGSGDGGRDELFEEAARLIVRHQQGSVSLLQRRLKVGYSRAARLVDELEMAGVVGPFDGSKAREVLIENEEQLEMLLKETE